MAKQNDFSFLKDVEELFIEIYGSPMGSMNFNELCEKHAGSKVYIPSRTDLSIKIRNDAIRTEDKGYNHYELALRYKLTPRQIRRIISHEK